MASDHQEDTDDRPRGGSNFQRDLGQLSGVINNSCLPSLQYQPSAVVVTMPALPCTLPPCGYEMPRNPREVRLRELASLPWLAKSSMTPFRKAWCTAVT